MEKIHTEVGYYAYKINYSERMVLKWGNVCDMCNKAPYNDCFYVPVLNYGMCESCLSNWLKRATYHEEDIPYEKHCMLKIETLLEQ